MANHDTKSQIQRAFAASGLATIPSKPGHRFVINPFTFIDPNTGLLATPFMAILASKNGADVAFLLAQHRAALRIKSINALRVWVAQDWSVNAAATKVGWEPFSPYMPFEIVDRPTRP